MSDLPMRDSPIPSRTSQDGNLRDALATALHRWDVSAPANLYVGDFYPLAEHVLADPAFRAALFTALIEACDAEWEKHYTPDGLAAAIVARVLSPEHNR